MTPEEMKQQDNDEATEKPQREKTAWDFIFRGMWRSPLGLMGITITTICATLMIFGLLLDQLGLIHNPYAAMITFMILPGGFVTGLLLIPIAAFIRRRSWHKYGIAREHLHINLSDHKHRKYVIFFIAVSVVNIAILGIIAYEGYHFTDSAYFCGQVCHTVMEPEYKVYQRSPHARIVCVECHIGPGADWFVRAKISGLRQVGAVLTNSYNRPVPAPVEHLRPARDTCEHCHWPEKFHGKKVKIFKHFTNSNQATPEVKEIALHIGGRNPTSNNFEGIHWHVSKNVEVSYLAVDERRSQIAKVKVKRPDGSEDEFVKDGVALEPGKEAKWRVMDCIDCHNRPTHVYDLPEVVVDFGLLSTRINPDIPAIREDALTAISSDYKTRDEAAARMTETLLALQAKRDQNQAKHFEADIRKAGEYLVEGYMNNVWPEMNIKWGTYGSHLGHQRAEEGYGCFRCHDEEHKSAKGGSISQDCTLCHDEPPS